MENVATSFVICHRENVSNFLTLSFCVGERSVCEKDQTGSAEVPKKETKALFLRQMKEIGLVLKILVLRVGSGPDVGRNELFWGANVRA